LCSPILIAESYHERVVIAKLCRIVQFSDNDRKKIILRQVADGRRQRLPICVHTVSVDSVEPRGRGVSTTVGTTRRCRHRDARRRSATKSLAD